MFDFAFTELMVCFVIALVVLGPERLPKVARTVGRFTGQARAYLRNFSAELDRETHASELRKQLEEANQMARAQIASLKSESSRLVDETGKALKPPDKT